MSEVGVRRWFADFFAAIRMLRAFFPYVRPHRWRIAFQILGGLVGSAGMAVTPLLAKFVFDAIVAPKNVSLFFIFVPAYVSAFVLSRALGILHGYIALYINAHVDYQLTLAFMNRLAAIPPEAASGVSTGNRMYSISSDIASVKSLIISIAQQVMGSMASLAVACVAMFQINWRVAIPILCVVPFAIVMRLATSGIMKKQSEESRTLGQEANSVLCESMAMMPLARLLGNERLLIRQYVQCLKAQIKLSVRHWRFNRWLDQLKWLVESGPGTAVSCYIWLLTIQGKQTIGSAVALSMYANMILPPVLSCLGVYQHLVVGLVAGERLLEFLRQPKEPGRHLPCMASSDCPPSVEFERVSFTYDRHCLVLDDLSFLVPAGSLCTLMGPSGVGKSTIIKLICRLYLPQTGEIYLGGRSLREVNPGSVRRQTSVAPQEHGIFTGTVRENLLFGNSDVSDERLVRAAELACAIDFIQALPEGFDTRIHSEQTALSAGQKQRLVLARAFLAHRNLLLLDEPFANIDLDTQSVLWDNLCTLRQSKTIIVVTHCDPPEGIVDQRFSLDVEGSLEESPGRRTSRTDRISPRATTGSHGGLRTDAQRSLIGNEPSDLRSRSG